LRWEATRLRERPVIWSLLLAVGANIVVFWSLVLAAEHGRLGLDKLVMFASGAVGTSAIAFGGLSWALDGAAAPAAAVLRLQSAMEAAGALSSATALSTVEGPVEGPALSPVEGPKTAIRFRHVAFSYPTSREPVLADFDLTIPAGSSLAIVGQNGAGKTTTAKLLCRLYDPQEGAIEVDGIDLREFDIEEWRARAAAGVQDFIP